MIYQIKQSILEIAKNNPEGFTISLPQCKPIKEGFVVAFAHTQNSFDLEGLDKALGHALYNDMVLGGWLNTDNNQYYFDSCRIYYNLAEAEAFAREQKQIAFYDLSNGNEIRL
jgi:hypothetical protein